MGRASPFLSAALQERISLLSRKEESREEEDAEATGLHPLELAALAHYKFVFIHPFYDGNGRVSRLLMNLVLLQAGYPPVIINVEDKHEYYQRLQLANDGDVRPFIRRVNLLVLLIFFADLGFCFSPLKEDWKR